MGELTQGGKESWQFRLFRSDNGPFLPSQSGFQSASIIKRMKFLLVCILFLSQSLAAQELEEMVRRALPVLAYPNPDYVSCVEPVVPNSKDEVNSVRTEPQRGCEPLLPGRHRQMNRNRYQSGNYVMRNLGNGRYAAVLNLDFVAGPGAGRS
jgi:hypothetical protein